MGGAEKQERCSRNVAVLAEMCLTCAMTTTGRAEGVRARARAQMRAEILDVAREHLAVEGAGGLSLRAVARDLGMASSAVYRYFETRDVLLTALIIDAYDALGAAVEEAEAPAPRSSDEAWIETIRCPSCNECQLINPRMFAYNDNKQAFIKDITAGTYRELVEAAESCQVAIIHPGKPRDPNEPGLAELIERAKPFL